MSEGDAELTFQVAIKTGLVGGSDYWARLALGWLEVIAPSEDIVELLAGVADARWASQATRHLARRLWRRFSTPGA